MALIAKYLLLSFCFLNVSVAYAHGEDRPGPHSGFIRMPGAFHIEVVPDGQGLNVYLLDLEWSHPLTEGSTMKAEIRQGEQVSLLACVASEEAFKCPLPSGTSLDKGELTIQATRRGAFGMPAHYLLPLKLSAKTH